MGRDALGNFKIRNGDLEYAETLESDAGSDYL